LAVEIELDKVKRKDAMVSLQRYAEENFAEPLSELQAGMLLDFLLEDLGPAIYNKGVADAGTRMQQRVGDLEGELFVDEFQYWARKKKRK
jgi:uncharacterized protein (DUF2164 family)